jgi:restriction system protein
MGNMSTLPDDREAFKDHFRQTHPDYHSEGGLAAAAGMLYQFVHAMRKGDIVVCPTPGGGDPVQIGEVVGDYQYEVGNYGDYHHLRKVKWLVAVPRENLSEAAKGNLRVTRSLHPIHKRAGEFLKHL